MKRTFLITLMLWIIAGLANAISVSTGTITVAKQGRSDTINRLTIDWLSDASGNGLATVTELSGTVERVVFNPDDGATSPTASYDITLTDVDSVDILNGKGANLSQTATTSVTAMATDGTTPRPMATSGDLTLTITSAGAARGGIIRIYFRR